MAILFTPRELGYQLQTMRPENENVRESRLATLAERVNAIRARLTIEPDPRANHEVLTALIGVVSASLMFDSAAQANRANPGVHTSAELGVLRQATSAEFLKLEARCRDHIEAVEAALAKAAAEAKG